MTDSKLREKYLSDPKVVWINGNSRTPKISKSVGMFNLHRDERIFKEVTFNENIIREVKKCYDEFFPVKRSKIIYALGSDRLGFKAPGSVKMDEHFDCDLSPERKVPLYRVQTVLTLNALGKNEDGGIRIFSNFHHYWQAASIYYSETITKPPFNIKSLDLDEFLKEVKNFYDKDGNLLEKKYSLPEKFIAPKWITVNMKPGEMICFDSRLPHHNIANKTEIDRIVAYISLYRKEDFPNVNVLKLFQEDNKHLGTNRKDISDKVKLNLQDNIVREVLDIL